MKPSSRDEVIYLILKCEHEDLLKYTHTKNHPNCTNDVKYKKCSISKEPQIVEVYSFWFSEMVAITVSLEKPLKNVLFEEAKLIQ